MTGCYKMLDNDFCFCIIQSFDKLISLNGEEIINEFDCPLMELQDKFIMIIPSTIDHIINIAHECTESCTFRTHALCHTIERQDVLQNALTFAHDLKNNIYSLNIFAMKRC